MFFVNTNGREGKSDWCMDMFEPMYFTPDECGAMAEMSRKDIL